MQETFGFNFADALKGDEWQNVCKVFEKRHLLAHKMGVIDEIYTRNANDPSAIVGRKVYVTYQEVLSAINMVETLGCRLFSGMLSTK